MSFAMLGLGFRLFNSGLVFEKLDGVLEEQVVAKAADGVLLLGLGEEFFDGHLTARGHLSENHLNLLVGDGEIFRFGNFAEDEADFDVVAGLLGGGIENGLLLVDQLFLRDALTEGVAGDFVGAALGGTVDNVLRQIEVEVVSEVVEDLIGLAGVASLLLAAADRLTDFGTKGFKGHFFSTDFFDELLIQVGHAFFFNATAGDMEVKGLAAKGFESEVFRQGNLQGALLVGGDAKETGVKSGKEVILLIKEEPLLL